MLVLFRKKSQRIHIGPSITITVCEFRDGGVRLGIEAPRDVLIQRDDRKPKPETVSDVLPSLDVRLGMEAEEQYFLDKHGPRQDPIGRETDPRARD